MYPQVRLRRLRKSANVRAMVSETRLALSDLIYPIFIVPGSGICREIGAMPGQFQYSLDALPTLLEKVKQAKLSTLLLFGQTDSKDQAGKSACGDHSVVCQALRYIKKHHPTLTLMTDVCLCSYTDHGHCGPIVEGYVHNDATLEVITAMAVSHAAAGADFVAPSGMMDGMVATIRSALDDAGHEDVGVLSYSVKYASSFYGPFREAADSKPQSGDRKSYQMNPANVREALHEAELDVLEGADMLMVKPGMPYLDILTKLHDSFSLPIVAYQVSGEYSMIKAASAKGWIDEKAVALESLLAFKRAGAAAIITYFALDVAEWLAS